MSRQRARHGDLVFSFSSFVAAKGGARETLSIRQESAAGVQVEHVAPPLPPPFYSYVSYLVLHFLHSHPTLWHGVLGVRLLLALPAPRSPDARTRAARARRWHSFCHPPARLCVDTDTLGGPILSASESCPSGNSTGPRRQPARIRTWVRIRLAGGISTGRMSPSGAFGLLPFCAMVFLVDGLCGFGAASISLFGWVGLLHWSPVRGEAPSVN